MDDDDNVMSEMKETIMGAVVILGGYCFFRFMNSPTAKALGTAVNGGANMLQWSLSSPWALLLSVVLGFIVMSVGSAIKRGELNPLKGLSKGVNSGTRGLDESIQPRPEADETTTEPKTTTESKTTRITEIGFGDTTPEAKAAAKELQNLEMDKTFNKYNMSGDEALRAWELMSNKANEGDTSDYEGLTQKTKLQAKTMPDQAVVKKLNGMRADDFQKMKDFGAVMDRNNVASVDALLKVNPQMSATDLWTKLKERGPAGERQFRLLIRSARKTPSIKGLLQKANIDPTETTDEIVAKLQAAAANPAEVQSTEEAGRAVKQGDAMAVTTGAAEEAGKPVGEDELVEASPEMKPMVPP